MSKSSGSDEVHFNLESRSYCVCCIDIVNSTVITSGFSESQVCRFYSLFLNTMTGIVKSFGAKVIKTLGDGILFYAPDTLNCEEESAFERALECCFALLGERRSINSLMNREGLPPIYYRISADYGKVQLSTTDDLFGSTVNICAKINRIARPNGVVIGGDLYRIVKHFKSYHFEEIGTFKMDRKFQYPIYDVIRVDNRAVIPHVSPIVIRNRQKVMVVDDEDDVLTTFRTFLVKAGYPVETYNDPEKALVEFAKSKEYALVLLDIRMPKINGLQLFQRMKAMNSKTNIIFITALDALDEMMSILPDAKVNALKKPVTREQFLSKVNSLISAAE